MKKLYITWIGLLICICPFAQNYISGVVSMHGDNTASGATTVAVGGSLRFNKNRLYERSSFINNGDSVAISADSGMLVLNGSSAQTVTGRFKMSALQLANGSGAAITNTVPATMITILDSVNFGNVSYATLNAGDGLMTLRSNAAGTARIADLSNKGANTDNKIAGKVIVERYIRSRRAWRLLCPPTTADSANDQTIQAAWQEGARSPRGQIVDPHPGYGTVITRPGNDPTTATGYDDGVLGTTSYSLRNYFSNGLYTQPANTDNTHFSAHAAYFLFVRGDRSVWPSSQIDAITPSVITTLRSKGALHNGTVIDTVTKAAGNFAGVGNPYACTIDLRQVALSGVANGFYIWDATLNIVGGYVYIDGDDNFTATPVTSVFNNITVNPLIQSGQAILVRPTSSLGTVTFTESCKNTTSRAETFRQAPLPAINISLYSNDSTQRLLDGTAAVFDNSFSRDALEEEDILKPAAYNEGLSFFASNQYLLKEKNPSPQPGDTLPLRLWKTTTKPYRLSINVTNLNDAPQAYLLDKYTGKNMPISAAGTTVYDFVVADDKNAKAIDRFAVVFGSAALPVKMTQVIAAWNGSDVIVHWNVYQETGIRSYEVQASTDGTDFTAIGSVAAHSNANGSDYLFTDKSPSAGDHFYRIKIINQDGSFTYSTIAVATVPAGIMQVAIYPNPVTNGLLTLRFKNPISGEYQVELYTEDGKRLLSKRLSVTGDTNKYMIPVSTAAKGLYKALVTTKEGKMLADVSVMIE